MQSKGKTAKIMVAVVVAMHLCLTASLLLI